MPPRPYPDDDELNRLLAEERFYAFPPALAASILDASLAPSWSVRARALGLVGAVLLTVAVVLARTGALPATPAGLPSDWVAPPVALPAGDLIAARPAWVADLGGLLVPAAVLLLAGGVLLARRLGRNLLPSDLGGAR